MSGLIHLRRLLRCCARGILSNSSWLCRYGKHWMATTCMLYTRSHGTGKLQMSVWIVYSMFVFVCLFVHPLVNLFFCFVCTFFVCSFIPSFFHLICWFSFAFFISNISVLRYAGHLSNVCNESRAQATLLNPD